MNQDMYNSKKKTQSEVPKNLNTSEPSHSPLVAHYLSALQLAPDILKIIGEGSLVEPLTEPTIRVASDYSYAASDSTYAGPGYRIVGDAAAFIDPFFSSGVHLALSSGLSAAASICAELRGECKAEEASLWHSTKVGTSYTRYAIVSNVEHIVVDKFFNRSILVLDSSLWSLALTGKCVRRNTLSSLTSTKTILIVLLTISVLVRFLCFTHAHFFLVRFAHL